MNLLIICSIIYKSFIFFLKEKNLNKLKKKHKIKGEIKFITKLSNPPIAQYFWEL